MLAGTPILAPTIFQLLYLYICIVCIKILYVVKLMLLLMLYLLTIEIIIDVVSYLNKLPSVFSDASL